MSDAPGPAIVLEENPSETDIEFVRKGLEGFNLRHAPAADHRELILLVRDADGGLAGGLLGETYWGWLHIGILWLDEKIRGQGFGTRLLAAAEAEARRRGCHHAHLDTMSFQALPFYEKQGYRVWGELPDLPLGHRRIFLSKALQ
jgi:GNAT superfamily N-acetyltransferase